MKTIALALCAALTAFLPAAALLRVQPVRAAHPAASARCENIQLYIQAQSGRGATGHIAVLYRIHNISGQPCTLRGYPGVRLLTRDFWSLPTTNHRGAGDLVGTIPVRTTTVPANGNAYFDLGYSDVAVGNQRCQEAARYVMIIPPNDYLPVVTYASKPGGSIESCTGDIYVSPVTSRPTFQ